MCYSIVKYVDLLPADVSALDLKEMKRIVKRCLPFATDLLITTYFASVKDSRTELELFFFMIIARYFRFPKQMTEDAADKVRALVSNTGKLWTEEQKAEYGYLPLDSKFFSILFKHADLNILLKYLPSLRDLVNLQIHFFIKKEAELVNRLTDLDGNNKTCKYDMTLVDDKYIWFTHTGIAAYKRLKQENFFRSEEEALHFLFDTTKFLQGLTLQDKRTVAAFFD